MDKQTIKKKVFHMVKENETYGVGGLSDVSQSLKKKLKEMYENEPRKEKKIIKIVLYSPKAVLPTRGSDNSAGLDIYADNDVTIEPGESKVVSTGLMVEPPRGTYIRIACKSSLSFQFEINGGVIDWDYRGVVKVVMRNITRKTVNICGNMAIAQMIVEKIIPPDQLYICREEDLSKTGRRDKAGLTKLCYEKEDQEIKLR